MSKTVFFFCCCYAFVAVYAETEQKSVTANPNDQYKVTEKLLFEIEQNGKKLGDIVFGLYGDTVPKTVSNFRKIALTGVNDTLTYVGSSFFKVVPRVKIQGGDIINNNGSGHTSIWNRLFEDENFLIKHSEAGVVSMFNEGKDENGCQFFITLKACPWYDGDNVAFGKVVKGMDVVFAITKTETNNQGAPISPVVVTKISEVHG